MRGHAHRHAGTRHQDGVRKVLPRPVMHAPQPGEDLELFSDRKEDAVEYESIIKDFALLHEAEIATDNYNS